jgi:DNA-binding transcriptional regulator YiaG
MNEREIIELLRKARRDSHIRVVDMATVLGYHEHTLAAWEHRRSKIPLKAACDIAGILGLELVLRPREPRELP